MADKYHFTIVHDPAIFSQQRLVAKLNFYGYQYIHELNDDMQQYQKSILAIGEELSVRSTMTSHPSITTARFSGFPSYRSSKTCWPNEMPHQRISLTDVILEAFKMNNGSIFNFFMEHHLQ